MATLYDADSTDDEIGVNLQLAERLRINRGDRISSPCEKKSLKNLYNQSRRKQMNDYMSSSSSSLDMHFDPFSSDASGSYGLLNKKRQNGDKSVNHFGNPKRTKVSLPNRLQRSPGKRRRRPPPFECASRVPLNSMPSNSSTSRHLLPDKVYEDHMTDEDDDSDFEPRKCIPTRSVRQNTAENPRHFRSIAKQSDTRGSKPKSFRSKPHVGYRGVQLLDSMSEEENSSKPPFQNAALKGGRQSPDVGAHKKVLRKAKKVLDSDSDDDWQVDYRMRPLILSSSDSEDSTPNGNKSSTAAATNFDSSKSDFDHSYHKSNHAATGFNNYAGNASTSQFNPHLPSSSSSSTSYRTKATSKRSYKNQGRTVPPQPTVQINSPINNISISLHSRGEMKYGEAPSTSNGGSSQGRTPRSHRYLVSSKSSKGRHIGSARNQTRSLENDPRIGFDVPESSRDNGMYRQRLQLSSTVPRNEDVHASVASDNRSQHPPSPVFPRAEHRIIGSHRRPGKVIRGSRPIRGGTARNNLAAIYPDLFTAEDSSEVEFFTAYSDNESTESLPEFIARNPSPGNPSLPLCPIALHQAPHTTIDVASSAEEDEISVVYTGPVPRSRGSTRTLGRRYNRRMGHPHDVVSLSPDPVEQVRQVEEDERFARMLQAQFDAEEDPTPILCRRNVPLPHLESNSSTSEESSDAFDAPPVLTGETVNYPRHFTILTSPPFQSLFHGLNVRLGNAVNLSFSPRPRTLRRLRNDGGLLEAFRFSENAFGSSDDSYEAFLGLAELNGDVPRGLQRSEIDRLPTRQFIIPNAVAASYASYSQSAPEVPHKRSELNKECQVCLNDYVNGDVLRILPCFHEFHTPCIDPWLKINHTCPVCRVIVDVQEQ